MACEPTKTREYLTSFPNGKIIMRLEVLMKGADDLEVKRTTKLKPEYEDYDEDED